MNHIGCGSTYEPHWPGSTPYLKIFNNSPCFTKWSPNSVHTSVQSSLYTNTTTLLLALIFSHYFLFFGPFIPFNSIMTASLHTSIASAKLFAFSWVSPSFLSSMPLFQVRQSVSSIGYLITLMIATLRPLDFCFHCLHFFQGPFYSHKCTNYSTLMESESQNKYLFPIYCLHKDSVWIKEIMFSAKCFHLPRMGCISSKHYSDFTLVLTCA